MDRQALIKKMAESMGGTKSAPTSTQSDPEFDSPKNLRLQLKLVHQYEKKIKLDSEEWEDKEWDGYQEWLSQRNDKSLISSLDSINVRRQTRLDKQRQEKKAAIGHILKEIKF